jgi:uncharacterized protein
MFYPRWVAVTDAFDLAALRLHSGEGRSVTLDVDLGSFEFGGTPYAVTPKPAPATLDVSRMTHGGYALRLRTTAQLHGPCMRCLGEAAPEFAIDVREVDQPGGGEELESPYVVGEDLDVSGWAHDALGLALPAQVLCRPDCAGLCPECGANLNDEPGHAHAPEKDPRWAALDALKFD